MHVANRKRLKFCLAMFDPLDDSIIPQPFGPILTDDEAVSQELRDVIFTANEKLCRDSASHMLVGIFKMRVLSNAAK